MMRCSNCNRDYPGDLRFCHQCGELLQASERPLTTPDGRQDGRSGSGMVGWRSHAAGRRRARAQSTSLYFAVLVLLAAGVGLALVWHQWWMPSLVRVSARVPEVKAPPPDEAASPQPAPETSAVEAPPVAPAPEPASPPDPAPPAVPAPVTARPAPPAPPAESAPRKVAPRPEPPVPDSERRPAATSRPPATAPSSSAARSDADAPAVKARFDPAPPPVSGPRVITLIPVGPGASVGARGQLHWESGAGGRLVVSGLPQLPPGRSYQLWLGSMRLGSRMSGGLLTVDAQGAGTLHVPPPRATWAPDLFGVTVERLGGAREPSDELVLVGELTRQATPAPAKDPDSTAAGSSTATEPAGGPASPASETRTPMPAPLASAGETRSPAATAAVPPDAAALATEGVLRIVPVPVERAWLVTQSALRSLGWDIERADRSEGLIRTEPRNVDYTNIGFYAAGRRHALDVAVRAVSSSHSSISVRRQVFEEQRILWQKERTILTSRDTAVEQTVLDAIEPLL